MSHSRLRARLGFSIMLSPLYPNHWVVLNISDGWREKQNHYDNRENNYSDSQQVGDDAGFLNGVTFAFSSTAFGFLHHAFTVVARPRDR
jgi:hypothetical protein